MNTLVVSTLLGLRAASRGSKSLPTLSCNATRQSMLDLRTLLLSLDSKHYISHTTIRWLLLLLLLLSVRHCYLCQERLRQASRYRDWSQQQTKQNDRKGRCSCDRIFTLKTNHCKRYIIRLKTTGGFYQLQDSIWQCTQGADMGNIRMLCHVWKDQ